MTDLNVGVGTHAQVLKQILSPDLRLDILDGEIFVDGDEDSFEIEVLTPSSQAGLYRASIDGSPLKGSMVLSAPVWILAPQIVSVEGVDDPDADAIAITPGLVMYNAAHHLPGSIFQLLIDGSEAGEPTSNLRIALPPEARGAHVSIRQSVKQNDYILGSEISNILPPDAA